VATDALKSQAATIASEVPNVKQVIDALIVKEPKPTSGGR
jgi:hypothetical protein